MDELKLRPLPLILASNEMPQRKEPPDPNGQGQLLGVARMGVLRVFPRRA